MPDYPLPQDAEFGQRLLQHFQSMLQGADLPQQDPHQIIPQTPQTLERDPYHLADHPVLNWLLPHLQSLMSDPGNAFGVAGAMEAPESSAIRNLFQRIQARDTLHHSTGLDQALGILQEGAIRPGRYQEKTLGWGPPNVSIKARQAGFTNPTISFSRAQRVGDPITFEVDPAAVKNSGPVQGLPSYLKSQGKFEFETATDQPVPIEGVRNILINTTRAHEVHGKAAPDLIARVKDMAKQRNIPVVEGTELELLRRRVLAEPRQDAIYTLH